ncbi:hypothetical protein ATANTOWER_029504 [Ataeniobius toweri]|uniref:Uncharacterized protein n=1 Tax=Ataeniobius toweri TaxID=208326 RepID=A0ABU7BCR9_9TELE|nr:hypothetical protein [Ataeniobius toweri]
MLNPLRAEARASRTLNEGFSSNREKKSYFLIEPIDTPFSCGLSVDHCWCRVVGLMEGERERTAMTLPSSPYALLVSEGFDMKIDVPCKLDEGGKTYTGMMKKERDWRKK